MNVKKTINLKTVFITAGAMMATLIGSGFATGQEIIQYFVAWGWWGAIGILVIFVGFSFVGHSFLTVGYKFRDEIKKPNDIFRVYSGKYLGTFYDYFSVFFLFLSYALMIGGAGATIEQQFSMPNWVGAVIMLIVVVIVVAMGLKKLTGVLGSLGPFIAIATLVVGVITMSLNWDNMPHAITHIEQAIADKSIQVASTSWWLAALNYVGFNMIWIAAFLGQQGKMASSKKEAGMGGLVGSSGFAIALFAMMIAFMTAFQAVAGSQVPTLVLANNLHVNVGTIFSIIVMLGIFTSAVTLLWNVTAAFAEDGTKLSRGLTFVFGIVGYFIGTSLEFDELVNVIYVINGYIGILLIAIMIFKSIQWKFRK